MTRIVTVERLGGRGRGVAHVDGVPCFVQGALPGETVELGETVARRGVLEARAVRILGDPHPARDPDPCPLAGRCGGCDWSHVRPEAGAALKREVAAAAARSHPEAAARLAAAPAVPSPLRYRLRVRLHWDPETARLGFYRRRSWEVVPAAACRLLSPRLAAALGQLAELLAAHVPVRADLEWLEDLEGRTAVAALRPGRTGPERLPEAVVPPPEAVRGLADGWHLLDPAGRRCAGWGADGVTMALPVPLAVPSGAFFQVNRHLVPVLFGRIAALAAPGEVPAWDLHAGVGLLAAAALTAGCGPLTLVEPFRPAALAARRNLPGARVVAGRTAEAYLARHRRLPSRALAMTDPPRAGMSPRLRHQLAGWHPDRILAQACDAATWARDVAFLVEHGYSLAGVELFDLFPWTSHVEVLSLLEAG